MLTHLIEEVNEKKLPRERLISLKLSRAEILFNLNRFEDAEFAYKEVLEEAKREYEA